MAYLDRYSIPVKLCRLMNYVRSVDDGPLFKFSLCFMDNVLIHSSSQSEHEVHLQEIFNRLRKYDIKLNGKKYSLPMGSIKSNLSDSR